MKEVKGDGEPGGYEGDGEPALAMPPAHGVQRAKLARQRTVRMERDAEFAHFLCSQCSEKKREEEFDPSELVEGSDPADWECNHCVNAGRDRRHAFVLSFCNPNAKGAAWRTWVERVRHSLSFSSLFALN